MPFMNADLVTVKTDWRLASLGERIVEFCEFSAVLALPSDVLLSRWKFLQSWILTRGPHSFQSLQLNEENWISYPITYAKSQSHRSVRVDSLFVFQFDLRRRGDQRCVGSRFQLPSAQRSQLHAANQSREGAASHTHALWVGKEASRDRAHCNVVVGPVEQIPGAL